MMRNPPRGVQSQEKMTEMQATIQSYNTRLEALVGAEAADAYRKSGGRVFSSFRLPAPPAPPTR